MKYDRKNLVLGREVLPATIQEAIAAIEEQVGPCEVEVRVRYRCKPTAAPVLEERRSIEQAVEAGGPTSKGE